MAAQEPKPASKEMKITADTKRPEIEKTVSEPQHEINKTNIIIGVVAVGALLFASLNA